MNKYRAIIGVMPRHYEISQWSEDQLLHLFAFILYFYDDKNEKITIEREKLAEVERYFLKYLSFETEVLYRLNQFTTDPSMTIRKFYYRLSTLIRLVGSCAKKHPTLLTDKVREQIKDNPRLNWMLVTFTSHQTKVGATVAIPDIKDTTTRHSPPTAKAKDPNVLLADSMYKMADLIQTILGSLTKKEIREMKATEKISALSRLSFIFSQRYKPNAGTFNQLNIFKADVKDLEQSLLDYGQK